MENIDIRVAVSEAGITYINIAKQMGISRVYLSRIMAKPLSDHHREKILEAIAILKPMPEKQKKNYVEVCRNIDEYDDSTILYSIKAVMDCGFSFLTNKECKEIVNYLLKKLEGET